MSDILSFARRLSLIAALALFASLALSARTLSPQEALARLASDGPAARLASDNASQPHLISTGQVDGITAYYLFQQGDRALIVGADDLSLPLLGFVDNPDFTPAQMPPAMAWWLSEYAREIAFAASRQAAGISPSPKTLLLAPVPAPRASRSAIVPMLKTNWNQDSPYNLLCPKKNNSATYTGCVATAMAQVMKYFQYPATGTGSNSYKWNNTTLSMNFADVTFDWDNMLPVYTYSTPGTAQQQNAVATLMKAVGYAVDMEYGTDADGGSGASNTDIVPAFVNHFSYDLAASDEVRDLYDQNSWDAMIYDNLANCGPVVYCGASSEGGHCFVCDGYRTDGYFHINWGWGGAYDGYFALSALNPEGQGIGGFSGGYNSNQDAVLGLRLPVAGSKRPDPYLAIYGGNLLAAASGREVSFSVASEGYFINMSSYASNFCIALGLTADGSTQIVDPMDTSNIPSYAGYSELSFTIPTSVPNGTYTAELYYSLGSNSADDFLPFRASPSLAHTATLVISDQGVTVQATGSGGSGDDDSTGEVAVTSFSSSTGYVIGQPCTVTATVSNSTSAAVSQPLTAYLAQMSYGSLYAKAQIGSTQTVNIPAKSSTTAQFSSTLSSSLTSGTYYLVFVDADSQILNTSLEQVTVKADSSGDDASLDNIWVDDLAATDMTVGQYTTITATFYSSNTSAFSFNASAALAYLSGSDFYLECTLITKKVSIGPNSHITQTWTCKVPDDLTPGTYYLAIIDEDSYTLCDPIEVIVSEAPAGEGSYNFQTLNSLTPAVMPMTEANGWTKSMQKSVQDGWYYVVDGKTFLSGATSLSLDKGDASTDSRIWQGMKNGAYSGKPSLRCYKGSTMTLSGVQHCTITLTGTSLANTYSLSSGITVSSAASDKAVLLSSSPTATLTFSAQVRFNVITVAPTASGIDALPADDAHTLDAPAQYFNLQGQPVANPASGLCILRQGSRVSKVIL